LDFSDESGGRGMFLKLLKTGQIEVDGRTYQVRYYERRTMRGAPRYSGEVLIGRTDRIILDDDTLTSLESRLDRLVPATIYSRQVAS
jgi:hypothetical protein